MEMHHIHLAIEQLNDAKNCYPNIMEQFSIFRIKKIIENNLMEELEENSNNIKMIQVIRFEELLHECVFFMEKVASIQKTIWDHLLSNDINLTSIDELNNQINFNLIKIDEKWKQLFMINLFHEESIEIYKAFLNSIRHNSQKALEVKNQIKKHACDRYLLNEKYRENDTVFNLKKVINHISRNSESIGKILNVSNGIFNLLGYDKKEIIHHSINMILPNYISKIHNEILETFIKTGRNKMFDK